MQGVPQDGSYTAHVQLREEQKKRRWESRAGGGSQDGDTARNDVYTITSSGVDRLNMSDTGFTIESGPTFGCPVVKVQTPGSPGHARYKSAGSVASTMSEVLPSPFPLPVA